jgi:DNA polymerase III subunit delta'
MRLSEIEAQDTAVRVLRSSIQRSKVAHAYLFAGPKSSGKTSAALAFAAALNCTDPAPDGDACGRCLSCVRIEAGTDIDVRLIAPDGNQTKIDQMQEMIRALSYAPISGRYKIFVIEQADTLNASSENCILKILEEPPSYVVLILLSCNANALLPTIRSRCRIVRFRRASKPEMEDILRGRLELSEDRASLIAAWAQGALGRALSMASSPESMEERQSVLQALSDWMEGPAVLGIQTAESLRAMAKPSKEDHRKRTLVGNLAAMLDHILAWYSDLLSLKIRGTDAMLINEDYSNELHAQALQFSTHRLQEAIQSIMNTRRYLEGNVTPQLALENMFFDMRPDLS